MTTAGLVQNISAVESNDYNEAIINQEPPVIAAIDSRAPRGGPGDAGLPLRALAGRPQDARARMQNALKDNGIDAYLLPVDAR